MHLLPVFLLLLTSYEFSEATTPNRCGVGYKSYGYTEPAGDIYLKYGNDLNITCVLDEDAEDRFGPNASGSMGFYLNERSLPVERINSTAIQLYIQNHQKTRQSLYYCKVKNDPVCSNVVVVGVPPQEVTDFSCIFLNYQNFTCTFTEPENYISTHYSLFYAPSDSNRYKHAQKYRRPKQNRRVLTTHACPTSNLTTVGKGATAKKSCFWSLDTSPLYRHAHTNFTFFLDASNYFGNKSMKFLVKHYERIKPNPPELLTGVSKDPHTIDLEWNINIYIQPFPIGLIGRVSWLIEEFKNHSWTSHEVKINSLAAKVNYTLRDLPYAHCLYDIRVALRSPEATDDSLWSEYKSVTVRTLSKPPDVPPKTTLGMFQLADGTGTKRIYWQNILANQENGENFSYFIEVDGYPNIKPSKIQNNYAEFQKLEDRNYTIRIWSINQEGRSASSSTVFFPSQKSSLQEVDQLIKVDNGGGSFDIQWKGTNDHRAVSYTLFWCSATKERPHPCDGRIYWEEVPLGVENKSVTLPTLDKQTSQQISIYQFAIAVNGVNTSSGMSWADCTVINESGFQLRQTHFVEVKSRSITLKWELECIRMGTIKSFEVKYCRIPYLEAIDCSNGTAEYKIFNNTDNSFGTVNGLLNVTGLKPYSSYMFMVKPILLSGKEMKFSPTLRNSTDEGAPTPPRNLEVVQRFDRNVTIRWDKPLESNGYLREYKATFNGREIKLDNVTNTAVITGLLPRTKYTLFVEACTKYCSEKASVEVTTDVGRPGRIRKPGSNFEGNNSLLTINWIKPDEPDVQVDRYEVEVGEWNSKRVLFIANTTEPRYPVDLCLNDKTLKLSVRVRAFNVKDNETLYGNWTDKDSFVCWESSSSWTVPVIVMGAIFFVMVLAYTAKTVWYKVVPMRDFAIKLPASLGPAVQSDERDRTDSGSSPGAEPLLKGDLQLSVGNPSGESSGCSSGTESVASSADTASHMSISDSGTDQPKSPSPSLTEPLEKDITIRQRPSVKKAEYLTMAEIPQTSWPPKPTQTGYSVIGLSSPPVKEVADPPYLPLSEIAGKSTFPSAQTKELPKPSSGYVACPPQEPPAKNTGYVVAGMLWKTD